VKVQGRKIHRRVVVEAEVGVVAMVEDAEAAEDEVKVLSNKRRATSNASSATRKDTMQISVLE
jgi:fructose/tagatose bisphosphate aldolase